MTLSRDIRSPLIAAAVVGRLAPSPTGALHIGHARSFLAAWWSARQAGGKIVLRFEDLDRERCRPEFEELARQDLKWLGLDWDHELRQSDHQQHIVEAAESLRQDGKAFPCVCSRADIREALAAPHGRPAAGYPGTCFGRYSTTLEAEQETGKLAGLRFRTQGTSARFEDAFAGPQHMCPDSEDFLILRRDKIPAYQLAVVVDDAAAGVTEVIRGEDLLASTPLQLELFSALGLHPPRYYHLPLVVDGQGARLAKRRGGHMLSELRALGVSPQRIVGWVARSCGLDAPQEVSVSEVLSAFNMGAIAREPVRVDSTFWYK